MDKINYYLRSGELKSIPYRYLMKQWINSYESKRDFLRDIQNSNQIQLKMGSVLLIQFLKGKYYAIMPEETDSNFQEFVYDSDFFLKELKFAINDMGPVYVLNPNFWESNLGLLIQVVAVIFGIGLFIALMEFLFT